MHKIDVKDIIPSKDEERYKEIAWNGKNLKVKYTIPIEDVFAVVDEASSHAMTSDGTYVPEMVSFFTKAFIIDKFTNIQLPKEVEDGQYLVYETDLFDIVRDNASDTQLGDIVDAIDKRVDYLLHSNIRVVENKISELENLLDAMQESFGGVFDEVSADDFKKLVDVMANGKIDEEKLVDAVIAKEAEEAK